MKGKHHYGSKCCGAERATVTKAASLGEKSLIPEPMQTLIMKAEGSFGESEKGRVEFKIYDK